MDLKEALEILEKHQKWRRDKNNVYEMQNPTKVGIAIDIILIELKKQQQIGGAI